MAANFNGRNVTDVVGFDIESEALHCGGCRGEGEVVRLRVDQVDLGIASVGYLLDGRFGFGSTFETRTAKKIVHDAGEEPTLHFASRFSMACVALTRVCKSLPSAGRIVGAVGRSGARDGLVGELASAGEDADFASLQGLLHLLRCRSTSA